MHVAAYSVEHTTGYHTSNRMPRGAGAGWEAGGAGGGRAADAAQGFLVLQGVRGGVPERLWREARLEGAPGAVHILGGALAAPLRTGQDHGALLWSETLVEWLQLHIPSAQKFSVPCLLFFSRIPDL